MSAFVLVHGAWHGGWCWERVQPLLQTRGHQVRAPTLSGLGDRSGELGPHIGLSAHVADVVSLLRALDEPAVLVGHSYAGLVVRQAADCAPDRVRELVLVDGWAGPNGSSLLSLAPEWFSEGIGRLASEQGGGWRVPPPAPAAVGVEDLKDAAWLASRLSEQPLLSFTEPTRLSGAVAQVPLTAILAPPGPVPFASLVAELGARAVVIDGGHDLMVTSPGPLADALLELA